MEIQRYLRIFMKKLCFLLFLFFLKSNAGVYKAVQLEDSENRSVYFYYYNHSMDCGEQGYYFYNNILKKYTDNGLNLFVEAGSFCENLEITKTARPSDKIVRQARSSCLVFFDALINDKRYMRAFNKKNIFITNLTDVNILKSILYSSVDSKTAIFAGEDYINLLFGILIEKLNYNVVRMQHGIFTEDGGSSFSWILD